MSHVLLLVKIDLIWVATFELLKRHGDATDGVKMVKDGFPVRLRLRAN